MNASALADALQEMASELRAGVDNPHCAARVKAWQNAAIELAALARVDLADDERDALAQDIATVRDELTQADGGGAPTLHEASRELARRIGGARNLGGYVRCLMVGRRIDASEQFRMTARKAAEWEAFIGDSGKESE